MFLIHTTNATLPNSRRFHMSEIQAFRFGASRQPKVPILRPLRLPGWSAPEIRLSNIEPSRHSKLVSPEYWPAEYHV